MEHDDDRIIFIMMVVINGFYAIDANTLQTMNIFDNNFIYIIIDLYIDEK